MKSPKQIIEAISEYHERIEVVAQDFKSGKNLFSKIDPYELATLLGEEPEDFASRTHCGHRISIESLDEAVHHYFQYLEGKISAERIGKLKKVSEDFENNLRIKGVKRTL
jgi:hypothetical protein